MGRKKELRNYPDEFKENAVQLLRESNRPLAVVARELNVVPQTLRTWRDEYEATLVATKSTGTLSGDERAELEMLRRQNRILVEEREILKKAAAFFAKETTR